jgi:phosphoribosylaminoimidazole-succinocarboxamide synthase
MRTGLLIFFATMSISLCIAYLSLFDKLKKCNLAITKLFLENEGLKEVVFQNKNTEQQSDDTIHKENFIKFLSDSRDWAFEYIETSQKIIKEVSEELKDKGLNNYSDKLMFTSARNKKMIDARGIPTAICPECGNDEENI